MLGIPSGAFGEGGPSLNRNLRRAGIAKELREQILALNPRSREEILQDPAIGELVRRKPSMGTQLIRVLVPPRTELVPPQIEPTEALSRVHRPTGLVLTTLRGEQKVRLAILDGTAEIASVNLLGAGLDHSSLRIFGFRPWDMPNVPFTVRRRLAATLFGPLRRRLYALAIDADLDRQDARGFRALAAVVTYTGSVAGGPPVVDDPGHIPGDPSAGLTPDNDCVNGCGPETDALNELVPDGSWTPCCNEHDLCYCKGECDACGRLECDNAFFKCMLRQTNLPQAYVYYLFVRAFGGFGSYECDEPFGVGGIAAVGGGIAIGVIVGYFMGSWQAGVAAGVAAIALLSYLLCNICEPLNRWRQEVQEQIQELVSWRSFRERIKRCKRKRGIFRRFWCRVKAVVGYIVRWVFAIILVLVLVVLWILEKVACGA